MSFNLFEIWSSMGYIAKGVVFLLAFMSIYALWVMIDRWSTFSKAKRYSLAFVIGLRERLLKKDLNGAMKLSKAEPQSPIARVIGEALVEYRDGLDAVAATGPDDVGDFDIVDAVNRAIDRTKEREVANLKKGLGGLASISSAAPFIGLFGTVVGVINIFAAMGGGEANRNEIMKGIGEALITTAVGLAVAIPAVMMFNYFTNAIESILVDINDVSSELITYVLREGRDRK
jgi:biopolymer transport protein ExbB/TolQ